MAEKKRLDWIDQARGLSIFLVVYGHNFPVNEPYIYSFHVPLFFFIAGMFHPAKINFDSIKKRAKMVLVSYFIENRKAWIVKQMRNFGTFKLTEEEIK